ncbi:soluble guanylate cyclase 88E-like isoform X4 [Stegostoma tigrinum]|uniref:soluble guanylate cyclase 88E-like isoform X4 n=1 Tax=Stegostoma tigrinum TaxID=3053191 RepID=UPI00202B9DA6|nr:soluble guanylate cyclase 88E-like isoform X4 [Stegostoma tigrinum]
MMYGLLCESLHDFIKESYGDDVWKLVRERADVRLHSFVTHEVYSESVIPRIAMAASGVTGTPYSDLMNSWGVYFLGFVGKYGYDRILKVLGRHVRDFVNGLDNLHEYLRFSYPKVQPPTFFCQEESATGVTLHYRSKRKGYLHYAMGQLRQMGKQFYDTDIHVEVLSEQLVGDYSHVTMRLNFDNSAYRYIQKEDTDEEEMLSFTSDFFFEVFPFNIVFRQDMVVHNVGSGLATVFPDLDGKMITDAFLLARPLVEFTWNMEQKKSSKLEESMKMLDYEMKKTDDLLYRMIPKPVAKSLRKGLPSVNTCEVFPDVTILFSDVVGFTRICSHITPMQVVSMLNTMYTLFDTLSEKHRVFKVETIGDAYMVVAGVPEKTKYHAHNICDMALDMVRSIDHLKDPSTGNNIQIRVGVHSGMVVAGVVGHRMPRFGLYGDTVHSASAMESNGKEMHIQLSGATYEHLIDSPFIFERRGMITIKGNVEIETYWLKGKRDKDGNAQAACPQFETQAISTTTLTPESSLGGKRELINPTNILDDEELVHSEHSQQGEIVTSTASLEMSMQGISTDEDSFTKNHYKESFVENDPEALTHQQEDTHSVAKLDPCVAPLPTSQNGTIPRTPVCQLL